MRGIQNFNLISVPLVIVRSGAVNPTFATVIEPHGYFSESEERSLDAVGRIKTLRAALYFGIMRRIERVKPVLATTPA